MPTSPSLPPTPLPARPPASVASSSSSPQQSKPTTVYLLLYNTLSLLLWFSLLGQVLALIPLVGVENVYGGVGEWAKWTQTLAVVEVGNSALGLTRSPLPTTLLQVSSRLLLIWAIVHPFRYFPEITRSTFYTTMLLAWSITEVVRYAYFAVMLKGQMDYMGWEEERRREGKEAPVGKNTGGQHEGDAQQNGSSTDFEKDTNDSTAADQKSSISSSTTPPPPPGTAVPHQLTSLRYSLFYVLYPMGILSEVALILKTTVNEDCPYWLSWLLRGIVLAYVPGSYVLYGHMIAQRRKVLGKGAGRGRARRVKTMEAVDGDKKRI